MEYGDPACAACRGKGRVRSVNGWRVCECVTPAPVTQQLLRDVQSRDDRPYMRMSDMLRAGSTSKERVEDG